MVRRLVTNVPKPMPFNVSVKYCEGVWLGIWNVRPRAYNGHRSKSHKLFHRSFGVIGSRLCIVPLLGSSRMTRLIIIVSSLVGVRLLYREDMIGYKRDSPWTEPALLAPAPAGSLAGPRGHEDKCGKTDYQRYETLASVSSSREC